MRKIYLYLFYFSILGTFIMAGWEGFSKGLVNFPLLRTWIGFIFKRQETKGGLGLEGNCWKEGLPNLVSHLILNNPRKPRNYIWKRYSNSRKPRK